MTFKNSKILILRPTKLFLTWYVDASVTISRKKCQGVTMFCFRFVIIPVVMPMITPIFGFYYLSFFPLLLLFHKLNQLNHAVITIIKAVSSIIYTVVRIRH